MSDHSKIIYKPFFITEHEGRQASIDDLGLLVEGVRYEHQWISGLLDGLFYEVERHNSRSKNPHLDLVDRVIVAVYFGFLIFASLIFLALFGYAKLKGIAIPEGAATKWAFGLALGLVVYYIAGFIGKKNKEQKHYCLMLRLRNGDELRILYDFPVEKLDQFQNAYEEFSKLRREGKPTS